MHRFHRDLCASLIALALASTVSSQPNLPPGQDLQPEKGVEFVLKMFERKPIVAIADLPGCEELHRFLRTLVQTPDLSTKIGTIVVDFGNPVLQPVIDRYVMDGELVPESVLRHVWDDTTESPSLTWDSPVYAQFFDIVRAVNLAVPKEKRIRVVLGDGPIVWRKVQTSEQWLTLTKEAREQALAEKINEVLNKQQHALVIAARSHLLRNTGVTMNTRTVVERSHPDQVFVIVPQSRFGERDLYKQIEMREENMPTQSIALLQNTWLGSVLISDDPDSGRLQDVADAVLYLGESNRLTKIQPDAQIFRDDEFWTELNRRWTIVHGEPFNLQKAGFDSRGQFDTNAPRTPAILPPPPSGLTPLNAADFVLKQLDQYPMVGIGDQHMCLEFYDFIQRLVRDPRLPGKIQDIVVEAGNPRYQALIDRYVLEGKIVALADRRRIWQEATMGWYEANSPVYEQFFDTMRRVNLALPKDKRIRVILGDAPMDIHQFRANPDQYLRPFIANHETLQDPREISLATAVNRVLEARHRGIIICGNGHLKLMGRRGNARHIFEPAHPGKFYLIDQNGPEYAGWPSPSIVVAKNDPEPNHATLWVGPWDARTLERPSPLVYRDPDYWFVINLMEELTHHELPLDLAAPAYEYRGRYFETH